MIITRGKIQSIVYIVSSIELRKRKQEEKIQKSSIFLYI